jgi:hypothetical protein
LISNQYESEHYEYVEEHTCAWLHPDGTDRLRSDPAGAHYALSLDIPGHCAGEHRDDTDHLPGSPASQTYVSVSQSPVTSGPLLLKCHHT